MHLSMFSSRIGGTGVGGGEGLRAYSRDYTAETVTALGNLTDDFGTGAAPKMFQREN